ncbi:MAG: hypothetical protein IT328_07770 [Caldilineaceae bacterium]|nr:hypothetical protein [Caldilineaceae bacterium]
MANLTDSIPLTLNAPYRRRVYRPLRFLAWGAGSLVVALGLYFLLLWPWISRWGATTGEIQQTLPGDDLIPDPAFVTTKAITIHAQPESIWPWLAQLGVDRGGMYSYLWVENWLLRLHVQNIDEIRPEWQTLQAGDFIRFTPKEFALNPGPGLYVLALEPNRSLAGCFGMEQTPPDCGASATWQFVLQPQEDGTTRLILRSRSADPGSNIAVTGAKVATLFQFYMERKMLLGIKQRAEMFVAQNPVAVAQLSER